MKYTFVVPALAVALVSPIAAQRATPTPTPQKPPTIQPGAPGQPSKIVEPDKNGPPGFIDGDVKFMQGMIGHHQQALDMVALLYTRTNRDDMKMLAKRIEVSQTDEIKMMQTWLADRKQEVPSIHAMHMHGAVLMPGMLSMEEMAALGELKGAAFDTAFLQGMIKHHGGALTMVKELLAQPGAAQQAEIYRFVSDVEADQSMEIARMKKMLTGGNE